MAIRLKDIADELGVSTMTVSKVLRGKTDVGQKTRERVLKRVRELNYRPNMLARGLASGRTGAIGLVVPDLVQPFFAELASSLAAVLRQNGYALLLASSEDSAAIEREEMQALVNRGVDAILLASCRDAGSRPAELMNPAVPCVLVDRKLTRLKLPFVGSDDIAAGVLATEHLIATGHRNIAHIGGTATSPALDRMRGYANALKRRGINVPQAYRMCNHGLETRGEDEGRKAMQKLLSLRRPPDAVFCYNDSAAAGAIDAVLAAGRRVPEDVAIIGCGNLRYGEYFRVPLSTVDQRAAELGELAARMVLDSAHSLRSDKESIRLTPSLVVRCSTPAISSTDLHKAP